MARDAKFEVLGNLNGGLNTRSTPLLIEAGKKMQSPSLLNCDFFPTGGIAKRMGLEQQGGDVAGSAIWASQTSEDTTTTIAYSSGAFQALAQKITASSSTSINQVAFKIRLENNSTNGYFVNVTAAIYSNSAGLPGTSLGESSPVSVQVQALGSSTQLTSFNFSTPVAVTSATIYWFVIKAESSDTNQFLEASALAGASANRSGSANGGSSWLTATNFDLYYVIYETTAGSVVNGLYDYRFGSASTQKVMAAMGGALYWNNAGTWTSLVTGLGSGQNNLWDFITLKDYLFTMDNANNPGRVWDGTVAYTTKLGFQATFSAAAAAGGAVTAGTYKLLGVTTLDSGGYRATAVGTVTTAGGNLTIAVTSVVMDGTGATDFGFDISATATKWFMTEASGSVYYKIPTGNLSTAANPMANNTTSFNITALTGLTAANTLLDEYGLEQAYFTSQVAAPTGKYMEVFQNMIALAGDATYPSRVWFSALADGTNLGGPQIWSTFGGIYGNYRDLDVQDGETITGLKEWNGNLYVFKRHSVHIIAFTGVSGNPFETRRLSGNLGALSHYSIKETTRGLVFISERGPCICTGTTVAIIPSAKNILDRFNPADSETYNLAAMQYTTAGNNSTKMQIHWGVSSTSATTRDLTLVYDYENDCFWENSISANYYAEVTDANFFPSVWSGNYSAQIFKHDEGTNDDGAAIEWYFETPDLQFGTPFNYKTVDHLFVSGNVQSSGTLTVSVYTDFSTTVAQTLTFDMSNANFKRGMLVPIGMTCTAIRFRLSNSELDVPVQIDSIGIAWENKGLRV